MNSKQWGGLLLVGLIFVGAYFLVNRDDGGTQTASAECGAVTIANMNWTSAQLMASVDKFILSAGYGCEAELIPGDTMPTFTSMNEKGEPDIAGELWINAVREPLETAFSEGRLHSANGGPITGLGEGWWIPPHTAEAHPELKTVLDIIERPDLFPHPEDPSKGGFVGCPSGWGCQLINANLFRAFNMEEKGWLLIDPGASAGLDGSMAKAVERGENWFGYYWSPTAMIGKYAMVKVPFGVEWGGDENWHSCLAKPEQECADPQQSHWIESAVHTVITDSFHDAAGPAVDYLNARVFPGAVMNEMLVYMNENQAEGDDAAVEFLRKHEDVWTQWVTAEVAGKVKAAL